MPSPRKRSRLYIVWCGMRARCNNPNHKSYADYGGRGIKVAPEWDNFLSFRDHILTLLPPGATEIPKGMSIDRKENDRGYEPGNVRITDRTTQMQNSRGNVIIEIDGVRKCATEWCRQFGITFEDYDNRVRLGWPIDRIFSTPKRPMADLSVEINGVTQSLSAWCRHYGVPFSRTHARIKRGWDPVAALTSPCRGQHRSRGAAHH